MNKSEPSYYNNNISDLLILNQSYVYDVDPNYFTMFSFKANIDNFNFSDIVKLNKVYNLPGSYLVGINYNDQSNNKFSMVNFIVTSSNYFLFKFLKYFKTFLNV